MPSKRGTANLRGYCESRRTDSICRISYSQVPMLRWCAYCQEFQGEIAPFNVFTTTHGLCPTCEAKGMGRLDSEIGNSHRLREIQGLLYEAGKTGDTTAASGIVRRALAAGLRPVDILVGLITPLLYLIGVEWEKSLITVADEHRFTSFCERVFELVVLEVAANYAPAPCVRPPTVFLMNAHGNEHSLGIRILSLWLQSKGIATRHLHPPPTPEVLFQLAAQSRPQAVLVSLALESQKAYVHSIARMMKRLPSPRPTLIVGGYAIKQQLIAPIPGALFVETITGLNDFILALD
jgi:methanogenic corrinoid protein MtbC1